VRRGYLIGLLAIGLVLLAPGVTHAAGDTGPVYDSRGNLIETPFVPPPVDPRRGEAQA
jgi:hypothetical protein